MTSTASGSSSFAAVLNPVKPSMATTSIRSRHAGSCWLSHSLKAFLERPSTMSNNLAGPLPSRSGVRSMITVTNLSPLRVCRHTCSSTPIVVTPSKRCSSFMRTLRPSSRTEVLAQSQDTPRPSATRATVRCWTMMPYRAQRSPPRDSFERGWAAPVVSCLHTCPHPEHR